MASGKYGLTSEVDSKVPDLPSRGCQRQTIPDQAADLPPAYEEGYYSHQRNNTTSSSAAAVVALETVSTSSTGEDVQDATPLATHHHSRCRPEEEVLQGTPFPQGYRKNDPMHWELKEQRGDWDKYSQEPGCLCSESGGILCSSRGGFMCSDREGYCCSDRNGILFSDRGGLLCSDLNM